jgi:hypothetical protein
MRPVQFGLLAFVLLPAIDFAVLNLVFAWTYTVRMFPGFWYCDS